MVISIVYQYVKITAWQQNAFFPENHLWVNARNKHGGIWCSENHTGTVRVYLSQMRSQTIPELPREKS